ncbi:hypothetical protein KKG08_01850 [Patescibacteria group bacterium]|nr:hypothetical protein [Patescibacteria group bacterium]
MYGFFISHGYNTDSSGKISKIKVTVEIDPLDTKHITWMIADLFHNGRRFKSVAGEEVITKHTNFLNYEVSDAESGSIRQRALSKRLAEVVFEGPFPGDGPYTARVEISDGQGDLVIIKN